MNRRFKGKRLFAIPRLRRVESLEARHCCSAEESLMGVSLESQLDAAEVSYQPDVQAKPATLEQPFVYEELIDPEKKELPSDEIFEPTLAEVIPESPIDECPSRDAQATIEADATSVGKDASHMRDAAFEAECSISINFPSDPDGFNGGPSKTNVGGGGELQANLSAPPVSTNTSVPSNSRPQLQPIEQLSIGFISIAMPKSVSSDSGPPPSWRSTPQRIMEVDRPLTMEYGPKTERTLDDAIRITEPNKSLREELGFVPTVGALLNTVASQGSVKRSSRVLRDARPQVAQVPSIMPEKIEILLPTVAEKSAKVGSATEKVKKQAAETDVERSTLKVIKKSRSNSGNEIGIALPAQSSEPVGKRGHLILGVIISGLVVFPRQVRDRILSRITRDRPATRRPIGIRKDLPNG